MEVAMVLAVLKSSLLKAVLSSLWQNVHVAWDTEDEDVSISIRRWHSVTCSAWIYVAVIVYVLCCEAAGEKELPLSYLFIDDDDTSGSDATALIYKLHTSDTIKYLKHFVV